MSELSEIPAGLAVGASGKAQHDWPAELVKVSDGVRNSTLTAYAAKLANDGLPLSTLIAMVKDLSLKACDPPLTDREFRDVERACKTAVEKFGKPLAVTSQPEPLIGVTDEAMALLEIPPREPLLPFLNRGDIVLILGPKGHGKSWVTLGCAYALASGGKLWRWPKVPKPMTGVFADGELLSRRAKERQAIFHGAGLIPGKNLHWLTPDVMKRRLNLYVPADRKALVAYLEAVGAEFVVLDNIAKLYRADGVSTNGAEWFLRFAELQDELADKGIATITAAHLGKDPTKGARGTSAIIDGATGIVEVARAKNWRAKDGAKFTIEVAFTRDEPDGIEPFGVSVEPPPYFFSTFDVKDAEEKAEERTVAARQVCDALREKLRKFPAGVRIDDWKHESRPMGNAAFYDAKRKLEEVGAVISVKIPGSRERGWKFAETAL
jgi:hypothetical protein